MQNWLKNQDYHLVIDNWKTKNSLDTAKLGCMREQILINPWISQYTRMKSAKILQKSKDFSKYIEDLMQFSEIQIRELNSEFDVQCKCNE